MMETSGVPFTMDVIPAGSNNCGNGMGGWDSWIWVILVFALIWGNNSWGGFGGNNGGQALTRGELCQDFNFQDLQNAVRSGAAENNANFRSVDNAICTLGYQNAQLVNGVQMQIGNEFRGLDNAVCTLGYNMQQGFNNTNLALLNGQNALSRQFADCCCEEQKNAMQTRYEAAQNTCATLQAIDKVGDRIIDYLSTQENQRLRDEVAQYRDRANSQYVINEVTNTIRPCPIPSYPTCNPWAANYGYNNYNGCSGCGCNA